MSLAAISVAALLVVIVVSCFTRLNVGVLAVAVAWIIGAGIGGFKVDQIAAGFPAQLFLTLVGMTLLFTQAQLNGTLDKLAHKAVRSCRGNAGVVPVMFFFAAAGLASIGPGNIASAALIAPVAMAVAEQAAIPAFLMAIMVANGANAGALSPFAPTGIIVSGLMAKIGLSNLEWMSYVSNLLAHAAVAFAGYFLFGGLRLFRMRCDSQPQEGTEAPGFTRVNWITLGIIAVLLTTVLVWKVNVGMGAFVAAIVLALSGAADQTKAVGKMPWGVIVMVSGVTVLIALLEKTQGLTLFSDLLARMATHESVSGVVAFVTGLVSVYASTSGVVLPAFLPAVPGLSAHLGGANPISIAMSMNVGAHLVDVSPLSTIGALCVAGMPASSDTRRLFNALLAWGLSMTVIGAVLCYAFFRT